MGVGGGLLLRDTFFIKVRLQISIDKFASLVSTKRSWVSLRLRINLFTEHFDEARCIRLLMQKVHLKVACLIFDKG